MEVVVLAAERRARILESAQRDGSVRVAQLVRQLGVSHVTVRRDVEALVHEGVLDKVRGGAMLRADATSAPHPPAGRSSTLVMGVVVPAAYYFRHVVDGVRAVVGDDTEVRLALSNYDVTEERRLIDAFLESGVTCLLLVPAFAADSADADHITYLQNLPVPVVLAERELPGARLGTLSCVRTAHDRGVATAMAHLAELGHQRVALLSRGDTQVAGIVRRSWHASVAELGLEPDVPNIDGTRLGTGPAWSPGGPDSVLDELSDAAVTALLCHGDEDALVLLQHARSRGLQIPADLSLVAHDDEFAALADPPLTAVAPHKTRVGTIAASLLIEMVEAATQGKPDLTPTHVQVEPRLHVRPSTGSHPEL
jgi:DNA-binding LacI/PurR family transcriptional regulator